MTLDNYHSNVDGASPSTMRVVAGAYKDDYEDVSEFSVSQQSFKIDRYIKPYGFKVYRKDILRAGGRGPRRVLDGQSRMANLNVTWREQELISYLDGLATYTTNEPAADDLPKLDNSGSNGNAGKIYETSVAGATFLVNGRLKGNNTARNNTADAVQEALTGLRLRLARRYAGGRGETIGGDPGTFYLVGPPEAGRGMVECWRQINRASGTLDSMVNRDVRAFASEAFNVELGGVTTDTSTAFRAPASATAGFTMYLMTPRAVTYAEEPVQNWTQVPVSVGGVNPGDFNSYYRNFSLGVKVINPELIMKVNFTTEAP